MNKRCHLLLLLMVAIAPVAASQTPSISRVLPLGIAPGRTVDLTLLGENLAGASTLWTSVTSGALRAVSPDTGSEKASFKITVSADTKPGIGAIRIAGTNGVSNLRLFMLDPLSSVAEDPENSSIARSQELQLPIAVDGSCQELKSDFYKLSAAKGHRLTIEVVAQRLGSLLDPRLRLLNAQGRELLAVDDTPGLGADCAISYKIPTTGDYIVELRDTKHEGGPQYFYRLRAGDFALARLPFLGDAILSDLHDVTAAPPSLTNEREPNDVPSEATRLSLPATTAGSFTTSRDRDLFEFEVEKGQRLIVRGRTRSLGSPCDLFLQIQDANGKRIAEANVTGADEGTITNTFLKAGTYRLLVEELNQLHGPDLNYRVEIRPLSAGFALSTDTENVSAPSGGSFEIAVKHARQDFDGPIALNVIGLGPGFTITNNLITSKTNETKLKVLVPSQLQPGDFRQIAIVGRAQIDGETFEARVSTLPALRRIFPKLPFPPDALDGLIGFGVSAAPK